MSTLPRFAHQPTDAAALPEMPLLDLLLDEHESRSLPRLRRLWDYYRNTLSDTPSADAVGRAYRLAQEQGLPNRLTRPGFEPSPAGATRRREIVVENDIAWRIHALVDFMFGKPVVIQSAAPDPRRATLIESFLRAVFEHNGGVGMFQDMALLGAVYGYVDLLLRVDGDEPFVPVADEDGGRDAGALLAQAARFVIEVIEAPRAVPVLDPGDYRRLDAYALHYRKVLHEIEQPGVFSRVHHRVLGGASGPRRRACVECTHVYTPESVLRFEGPRRQRRLREESVNRLGRVPVVHIQNLAQPFFYEGLSEVEPLIPLQDELNTRLSDRANRVTFQSFKMYLGKNIDRFTEQPVGPGQMWATDNPDASIEAFGGDADCPSETAHINEIREAIDKASGVTPIAAGLLRNKVGNLTSENALRIVMMGLLSRTEKKRVTYGHGIERVCDLLLHAADVHGLLRTAAAERRVRLDWPSPLPADYSQQLRDAQVKLELGVPRKQVLGELGYTDVPTE